MERVAIIAHLKEGSEQRAADLVEAGESCGAPSYNAPCSESQTAAEVWNVMWREKNRDDRRRFPLGRWTAL